MATNRHRRGGRTTPKGTQPSRPRQGQTRLDPMTALIQEGGDDLLRLADPLAAEVWASHTIGTFYEQHAESSEDDFERLALERCRELRTPQAAVAARALTAVATPPLDELGRQVQQALADVELPGWVDQIGKAMPLSGWTRGDATLVRYRQGGTEHGLVLDVVDGRSHIALVDYTASWQENATETPLSEVFGGIGRLLASSTERTEGFADNRALVEARLRASGDQHPGSHDL